MKGETMTETHKVAVVWEIGEHFQVICSQCGDVGQPQEYAVDAEAIARRHSEAQGFER
jgi:hypothetical protein